VHSEELNLSQREGNQLFFEGSPYEHSSSYVVSEPDSSLRSVRTALLYWFDHTYRDSPDLQERLDDGISHYVNWRDSPLYLVFRSYSPGKPPRYNSVLASKRGNTVYRHRVKKRFKDAGDILPLTVDVEKSAHSSALTNALFVTLTYDRTDLSIGESWDDRVSSDFHRFYARLRKKYGRIAIMRAFSAHRDGYPHVHLLIFFADKGWLVKSHEDMDGTVSRRLADYDTKQKEFGDVWGHGHVDVKGVINPNWAINYIMGYITGEDKKNKNLLDDRSLFLSWLFRKRSFSISNDDLIGLCIPETKKTKTIQLNLENNPICEQFPMIELVGLIKIELSGKPPPFSIDLERHKDIKEAVLSVMTI